MRLHIRMGQEIVFLDKPAGLGTHAPDVGRTGLTEWAERRLGQKLWVVHRLDKTTTGALAMAASAARAEELRRMFEAHEVRKKYWFLTDRRSSEGELEIASHISKQGSGFVSDRGGREPNATTRFRRVKRSPFFELWEAAPQSGRPHQVRLHAADAGLPILGDPLYGGTSFPSLCLHALSLTIPGEPEWTCPAPRFFERLGVLKDPELVRVLAAVDRRERLFHFLGEPDGCLRLAHDDLESLRLDKYGSVLWLHWYRAAAPTERDLERWDFVRTLVGAGLVIQKRQDRGQDPNTQSVWQLGQVPERWTARENGLSYGFRRDQGLSAGLFLDQRLNRERVRAQAPGRRVLNLFAYTAGFSLAAAAGHAAQVTTVDLSRNFLDWGKENFRRNGLDPEAPSCEWVAADSFVFLRGAAKRGRQWDLIVCDPPSFSRAGKSVFKLKDDLETLLEACRACLAPGGALLFSCNIESMSREQIEKRLQRAWPRARVQEGEQDLDFEWPDADEKSLKSFWVEFP